MTREEAARILEAMYGDWDPLEENNWQALRKAIVALCEYDAMAQELKERRVVMPILAKHERELLSELEKREWVRTSDRLPTENDADHELCVLAIVAETQTIVISRYEAMDMLDNADRLTYSYWMPLPKLPEVEG